MIQVTPVATTKVKEIWASKTQPNRIARGCSGGGCSASATTWLSRIRKSHGQHLRVRRSEGFGGPDERDVSRRRVHRLHETLEGAGFKLIIRMLRAPAVAAVRSASNSWFITCVQTGLRATPPAKAVFLRIYPTSLQYLPRFVSYSAYENRARAINQLLATSLECRQILEFAKLAARGAADLVVFPNSACAIFAADLIERPQFIDRNEGNSPVWQSCCLFFDRWLRDPSERKTGKPAANAAALSRMATLNSCSIRCFSPRTMCSTNPAIFSRCSQMLFHLAVRSWESRSAKYLER